MILKGAVVGFVYCFLNRDNGASCGLLESDIYFYSGFLKMPNVEVGVL